MYGTYLFVCQSLYNIVCISVLYILFIHLHDLRIIALIFGLCFTLELLIDLQYFKLF